MALFFHENGGTKVVDLKNGGIGPFSGAGTAPAWISGRIGRSLFLSGDLNGSIDFGDYKSVNFDRTDPWSVVFLSRTGSSGGMILSRFAGSLRGLEVSIRPDNGAVESTLASDLGTLVGYVGTVNQFTGDYPHWNYVTYRGTSVTSGISHWVDGRYDPRSGGDAGPITGSTLTTQNLWVGSRNSTTAEFLGDLGCLLVLDRAIDDDDVAMHYADPWAIARLTRSGAVWAVPPVLSAIAQHRTQVMRPAIFAPGHAR